MKIIAAGSAFPGHQYPQQEITRALQRLWSGQLRNPETLQRLHTRCGVETRFLTLPLDAYERVATFGRANDIWAETAVQLGYRAICRAVTTAGIRPTDLDAMFFTSVTGIASPSIDAKLVNKMGLAPHIKRIPMFGLGCVAGAAGIARAADYVRAFPDQIAALLSVELCSLTWQRDDVSLANLISSGLFGDGAAAIIVAGAGTEFEGPKVVSTRSVFYPQTEDVMGWKISEAGFHIVLSPDVPNVIRQNLAGDVNAFLAENAISKNDIESWIIHTGGPKVLDAVSDALELPENALAVSWECLRKVGNLSSASVLLVLQDHLAHHRGTPGAYSLLAAMGPGFCCELVLLQW